MDGLSMSRPFSSNREPWQGQSQLCSCGLYFSAQPRWGQRGAVGVSRPTAASAVLIASWGCRMEREGENRAASITTSRHGAIPAMPTLKEVRA